MFKKTVFVAATVLGFAARSNIVQAWPMPGMLPKAPSPFEQMAKRYESASPADVTAWRDSFKSEFSSIGGDEIWVLTAQVSTATTALPDSDETVLIDNAPISSNVFGGQYADLFEGQSVPCKRQVLFVGPGSAGGGDRSLPRTGLGAFIHFGRGSAKIHGATFECNGATSGNYDSKHAIHAQAGGQGYFEFDHELFNLTAAPGGLLEHPLLEDEVVGKPSELHSHWHYECRALETGGNGPRKLICSASFVIDQADKGLFTEEANAQSGKPQYYLVYKKVSR